MESALASASPCFAPGLTFQQSAAPSHAPSAASLSYIPTPITTPTRPSLTVGDDIPPVSVVDKGAAAAKPADKSHKRAREVDDDADEIIEEMGPDSMVVDSLLTFLTNYTSSLHNLGTSLLLHYF